METEIIKDGQNGRAVLTLRFYRERVKQRVWKKVTKKSVFKAYLKGEGG